MVDVEIYMNNIIKFFRENPTDLLNLVPKDKEEYFYTKIKKVAIENYEKGEADMMALYNGKYQEALALAKRLGDGMERQDAYRSGQYRQAVT